MTSVIVMLFIIMHRVPQAIMMMVMRHATSFTW
jgi:hypothetical protein